MVTFRRKRGLSVIPLSILLLCETIVLSISSLSDVEPSCDSMTAILDKEQLVRYERDGFILMKNVISKDLVDRLAEAGIGVAAIGQKFPLYFSVVERGVMFDSGLGDSNPNATRTFREAALYSTIPQIAAELMKLDKTSQNLRVLR